MLEVNPIQDEDQSPYSEQLDEEFSRKRTEATVSHFASKIREDHPELKDTSDDEALQVAHSVDTPNATNEEYWKVLHDVYGPPKKLPEPSLVQKGISRGGDFINNLINDVTAFPKGIAEGAAGLVKTGEGLLQASKSFGAGPAALDTPVIKEGQQLQEKSIAHLTRGGAFAAGLAASGGMNELIEPFVGPIGSKLVGNALRGAVDAGSFMGTYDATRKMIEPDVMPQDIWTAFEQGFLQNAAFGAFLGAGGTIGAAIMKRGVEAETTFKRAWDVGKAVKEADTLPRAKAAAIKFAEVFPPELASDTLTPEQSARKLIETIHGQDVLESLAGKKAVNILTKKIDDYQKNILHTTFAADVKEMPLANIVEKIDEATPVEKDIIQKELLDRELGVSPITSNPSADVTQNQSWTTHLKETVKRAEENPNDVLAQDEAFRAKSNFEAWKNREAAKKYLSPAHAEVPKARLEVATEAELNKAILNPNFKEEVELLRKNGATDEQINDLLLRSLDDRYKKPYSELASGENKDKVYAGFDPSLIRKLAGKMYQNGLGRIVPKELVQNAVDAVRGKAGGKIWVDINTEGLDPNISGNIRVIDNGHGMSPDVIQKELVDLGSSIKPENASGGFGLAKAALFANASKIKIASVAEINGKRVLSTLEGSGKDWASPAEGLTFKVIEIDESSLRHGQLLKDSGMKNNGTGTSIFLEFPKKDVDGNKINFERYQAREYTDSFSRYSRLGIPIEVKFNDVPSLLESSQKVEPLTILNFPGADITIYGGTETRSTQFPSVQILNNGLPQFNMSAGGLNEVEFPIHIVADVKSTVPTDNINYPFTTSREALSEQIESAIRTYIQKDYAGEAIRRERHKLNTLIDAAPTIGNWTVLDISGKKDVELINKIAKTSEYIPIIDGVQNMFNLMQRKLADYHSDYINVKFSGITPHETLLGVNIQAKVLERPSSENLIFFNPWTIYAETMNRVGKGIIENTPIEIAEDYTWQVVSMMIHELTHQVHKGHDALFAGGLTRNTGYLGGLSQKTFLDLFERINNNEAFFNKLAEHSKETNKSTNGENLFKKISDDATRERGYSYNEGSSQTGKTRRDQSSQIISSSNVNPTSNISDRPIGKRDFSAVEKTRKKLKIPNLTQTEAQVNLNDYLPIQELGKEELWQETPPSIKKEQ